MALRAYTHGGGYADDSAQQEARIREAFAGILNTVVPDVPEGMFAQAIDELIARILGDMRQAAEHQSSGASASAQQ